MEPEAVYTESQDGTCGVAWVDELVCVAPQSVKWLWPGRVPLGKVTLLVGDPGRGKSLLALDLAARVSRGGPWPDAAGGMAPLGRTVLLSAEDDTADTIRPRLDALGGDPNRVSVVRAVSWEDVGGIETLSLARDIALLEAIVRKRSDTRLIVLDPISAYLGGGESYNNADIRRLLTPVRMLAESFGVAVLAITHFAKRRAASVLQRAMGSVAFGAAARAVWAALPDPGSAGSPQAAGRMLFVPVKCNLSAGISGLAYRIVPSPHDPAVPIVAWEPGAVALTADEAMEPLPKATLREAAAEWLEGVLAAGPVLTQEVERRGRQAGYSARTLVRAKESLGIVAFREGYQGPYLWRLPGASGLTRVGTGADDAQSAP